MKPWFQVRENVSSEQGGAGLKLGETCLLTREMLVGREDRRPNDVKFSFIRTAMQHKKKYENVCDRSFVCVTMMIDAVMPTMVVVTGGDGDGDGW